MNDMTLRKQNGVDDCGRVGGIADDENEKKYIKNETVCRLTELSSGQWSTQQAKVPT